MGRPGACLFVRRKALGIDFAQVRLRMSETHTLARSRRILSLVLIASFAPALGLPDESPPAQLPAPRGAVTEASSRDWDRIAIPETGCFVVNNVWNRAAAAGTLKQEIFLEELDGKPVPGWRWSAPARFPPIVLSQPQIVCGDKPWDPPARLRPDFPFRAGSQHLEAHYQATVRASGVYNLAFTMWAAASPHPAKPTSRTKLWCGSQTAANCRPDAAAAASK
jgi:hypothetical protein